MDYSPLSYKYDEIQRHGRQSKNQHVPSKVVKNRCAINGIFEDRILSLLKSASGRIKCELCSARIMQNIVLSELQAGFHH